MLHAAFWQCHPDSATAHPACPGCRGLALQAPGSATHAGWAESCRVGPHARSQARLRCGHARQPRPPILRGSTPRRDDGYEEHGEAGADFAMIGHLHEQRKQLLATIEQSESELGSVVLQLSSLESGGGLF